MMELLPLREFPFHLYCTGDILVIRYLAFLWFHLEKLSLYIVLLGVLPILLYNVGKGLHNGGCPVASEPTVWWSFWLTETFIF